MQVIDQMGRKLELELPAKRIISLVPSQTEFLHSLGLEDEVVGLTKFCIHPESWWREKKRVGGTKNVDIEKVRHLKPDLIIGNKEENSEENINALKEICPVWMSDIANLDDTYQMMTDLGTLTGKNEQAKQVIREIRNNFSRLNNLLDSPKVIYFIWKNPWMCAGKNTFIDSVLEKCGLVNAIDETRYPILEENNFPDVDFVFLSSEPYPFKGKDILELKNNFPNSKIVLVDGEFFSWYGSRLIGAPDYFNSLFSTLHE